MKEVYSTHQVAKLCHVHLTTVINWVNEGVLKAYATPGGHRRIKRDDLFDFMKKFNIPLPSHLQPGATKKILVIDDDIDALEELKDALSDGDYVMDFALSGFEAGRKIYRRRPDLILLDFKMPGMDGFQVCDFIKGDVETAHIDIIAITSLTTDEEKERIQKCGVREYIAKPIDIDVLKKTINDILYTTKSV